MRTSRGISRTTGAAAGIIVVVLVVAAVYGFINFGKAASSTSSTSSSGITSATTSSVIGSLTSSTTSSKPFNLTLGTTEAVRWLDSSAMSNDVELLIGSQIYETLLRNNPVTGVPQPWLAQNYTVSPDGTVYTFNLRHGITFTDGTPFNAQAVKFSLIRGFEDPNTISYFLGNTLKGVTYGSPDLAANASAAIQIIDNYTIAFHLTSPNSAEPYIFAMANTGISSPAHYNRTLDQYVGTGPFKFVSWARSSNVQLVPNPNYWNKANQNPNIKSLTFDFFSSSTAEQAALQTNQIDVGLWAFTPTQVNALSQDSSLTLVKGEINRFISLLLNNDTASSPLNNELVRQAIAWSLNDSQIMSTVYGSTGTLSPTLMPPGYQYVTNAWSAAYPHQDIAKAKQLLAQAGYPNGFSTTLWYSPTQYGESETPFVTLVQQELAQVGITLTLNPVQITAFIQAARAGTPSRRRVPANCLPCILSSSNAPR